MRTDRWRLVARVRAGGVVLLMAGAMALVPALARAQDSVVAVPWFGSEAQPHQVYSGGSLLLQAVASKSGVSGSRDALPLTSASWLPGDGTGPFAISVANPLALELTHTYTGSLNQPFTATITVVTTGSVTLTDTFKVVIRANSQETLVNMAIDKGLWNLHKRLTRTTSDSLPSGYWNGAVPNGTFHMAATAGVVQAFEVNNHRESGDVAKDPYVEDVARGLRYMLSQQHGILSAVTIGLQTTPTGYTASSPWPLAVTSPQNPDANGNTYGLYINHSGHASYLGGQLMDALVASGTPNKTADTGQVTYVRGRSYKNILQDMLDGYSWGLNDSWGGWNYNYNDNANNDTSASHWWAIGTLASHVWGLDAPDWVKNIQWNVGVTRMQRPPTLGPRPGYLAGCYFGYSNNYDNWWGDNQMNVTAAGLVLMNADGVPKTNARYTCAMQWLDNYFTNQLGNYYTMYQTAKGMRTAIDSTGANAPITLLNGTRDWYAAYANYIITHQDGAGAFPSSVGSIAPHFQGDLASSWALLILSPSLFELPPTAVCSVDATTVCQAGAVGGCNTTGTNPYSTVNFDGSQSTPGDNPIAGYSWNFDDGGPTVDASAVTASTQYTTTGTHNVQLTVTDTKGNSSQVTCPVSVTASALPPIADAGGPYNMCIGTGSLMLDGSGSTGRGSNIVSYEWDFKGAINFAVIDATGITSDQTAYFNSLGVGTHDVGLRITDDNLPVNTVQSFTTVTVVDCTPPVITVPANITVVTPNASAPVTFAVSATDNVDASVSVACTSSPAGFSSGSNFPAGTTTTFTCNATDQAGNHAVPTSFTVTVKKLATATANPSGGTYNGNPYPGNGSCTPVSLTPVITYAPGPGAPVDAGTTSFTVTCGDGDVTYQTATAIGTITVTKAPVTATAGGGENVYDGATHAPSACAVTGAYTGDLTCANSPTTAGPDVGTTATTPVVSGTGLDNYEVTSVSGSYKITPATPVATANAGGGVYGGSAYPGSGACSPASLTPVIAYTPGPNAPVDAGTTSFTVTCGDGGNNYTTVTAPGTITITKAPVTATAGGGETVYDGAPHAPSACAVTGAYTGDLTCANSPASAGPGVGTTATTPVVSGTGLGNYDVTAVSGSYKITRATPVATANPGGGTYNGTAYTGSGTCSLGPAPVISYASGSAPIDAGTTDFTVTCGDGGNNYTTVTAPGTITITKAPVTATAGGGETVYDGAPHAPSACAVTGAYTGDLTCANSPASAGPGVGTTATTPVVSGTGLGNYEVTSVSGSYKITLRPVTITAAAQTKHFGTPDPPFANAYSVTSGSVAPGDSFSGSLIRVAGEAVGSYAILQGSVALNANYALAYVGANLTITNTAPSCEAVAPSISLLWPPNHQLVPVAVNGVTDADGDSFAINVTRISQDEMVGSASSGNTGPDGTGVGTSTARVRAERNGDPKTPGNGRVYHIFFTATDPAGGSCSAELKVGVPHDQSGKIQPIDNGALYDSTIAVPKK